MHFSGYVYCVDKTQKPFVLCESRSADFYPCFFLDGKQMKSTNEIDCRFKLCTRLMFFFFGSFSFPLSFISALWIISNLNLNSALQIKEFVN